MCSHYQAIKERERYAKHCGVVPPVDAGKHDVWPCYPATFIRRPSEADVGDEAVPDREALLGLFGLIPHWATDTNIGRQTYNARTETVAAKPSFRDAWKNAQHCIIPVDAFFEPDWRSGKAIPTRISCANGDPMGIAGLWSSWKSAKGVVHSFASSVKSVGELRLRKLAKHVIQGELSDSEGAKPVGFSHGHFDLVV